MLLSALISQVACHYFFLKAHSLLLPQYLFVELHTLCSSKTLQCSHFFSAIKLNHCSQQCSESGKTETIFLTSQNTGLNVHSSVSIPREEPGYGRFPPSCTVLCWVEGGARTHKIPQTFLLLSMESLLGYALA